MTKVSTSLLSVKGNLVETVKSLNNTDIDYFHIDVMDGKFVDNKTFSIEEIAIIDGNSTKPLDVHLMVEKPVQYINDLANYNVHFITFHYETGNVDKYIELIKSKGIKSGLSIKPTTSVTEIVPYLDKVDMILIMSVEPGYGGQAFLENTVEKIKELRNYSQTIIIEVDGGINEVTAKKCLEVGANILVSGSYITNSDNYQGAINKLR